MVWSTLFLVLCEAASALVVPLFAQVQRDCNSDQVARLTAAEVGPEWTGRRPTDLMARLAPLREQGRWSAIADSIAGQFERVQVPEAIAGPFRRELDSLKADLTKVERDHVYRITGQANTRRFIMLEETDPRRFRLFVGPGHSGVVTISDSLPQAVRRAVCWTAIAARSATVIAADSGRWQLVGLLEERVARWDNFREKGYSMFPLELVLNGLCKWCRAPLEPPRVQLIALHVTPAVELAGHTWNDRTRLDVIAVETGVIRYNDNRTWYGGVSAVTTFAANAPTGIGALLHFGEIGTVGYVVRRKESNGRKRDGIVLSLDLYRFIATVPESFRKDRVSAVAALATCASGMTRADCSTKAEGTQR